MIPVRINKSIILILIFLSFFSFFNISFASLEISDGSVKGLWHFNGDSVDSSGNGYNGADTSIVYATSSGKLGQGADFNGTNSKINFDNVLGSVLSSSSSVAFWLTMDANNLDKMILDKFGTYPNPIYLYSDSLSRLQYALGDGVNQGIKYTTSALSIGSYIFVVVSYNNNGAFSGQKIYINGAEASVGTSGSFTIPTNGANSLVAGATINDLYANIKLDELIVFNKVLTQTDIDNLYNLGNGIEVCVSVGCGGASTSTATSTQLTGFMSPETDEILFLLINALIVGGVAYFVYRIIYK